MDAQQGRYLGWDDATPTADAPSVYLSNNLYGTTIGTDHDPVHFLTMKGIAAGDLDNISFDLYFNGWAQSTVALCGLSLSFQLTIDGKTILDQDYLGSDGIAYEYVDDQVSVARFSLTNLWSASKLRNLAYGPDVEHEVYLNIQNFYLCNELTWLYDGVDTPSGLVVNHPNPGAAAYTVIDVRNPPPPPTP